MRACLASDATRLPRERRWRSLFDALRHARPTFLVTLTDPFFLPVVSQRRNPKKNPVPLEMMKYDPRVKRHVLFTEKKMK